MSHDRGCPCGREKWEYDSCPKKDCTRRTLPSVTKLGPRAPICEAMIGKDAVRRWKACNLRAKYEVRGKKFCAKHAGIALLKEWTK